MYTGLESRLEAANHLAKKIREKDKGAEVEAEGNGPTVSQILAQRFKKENENSGKPSVEHM